MVPSCQINLKRSPSFFPPESKPWRSCPYLVIYEHFSAGHCLKWTSGVRILLGLVIPNRLRPIWRTICEREVQNLVTGVLKFVLLKQLEYFSHHCGIIPIISGQRWAPMPDAVGIPNHRGTVPSFKCISVLTCRVSDSNRQPSHHKPDSLSTRPRPPCSVRENRTSPGFAEVHPIRVLVAPGAKTNTSHLLSVLKQAFKQNACLFGVDKHWLAGCPRAWTVPQLSHGRWPRPAEDQDTSQAERKMSENKQTAGKRQHRLTHRCP